MQERGLRQVAEDVRVVDRSLRFLGAEVGTRMTVVRLSGGRLWVHSPVEPDAELCGELDRLGTVSALVAPNRFHHLFARAFHERYPDARLFAAPGLPEKRADLPVAGVLSDEAPEEWRGEIDQVAFRGFPLSNEVVFFHRASRTLIAADLAFNVCADSPLATRIAFVLAGGYGELRPSRIERWAIRDRAAARESLERILSWDFDRVIVAHGHVHERGSREALRRGYAWLLRDTSAARASTQRG